MGLRSILLITPVRLVRLIDAVAEDAGFVRYDMFCSIAICSLTMLLSLRSLFIWRPKEKSDLVEQKVERKIVICDRAEKTSVARISIHAKLLITELVIGFIIIKGIRLSWYAAQSACFSCNLSSYICFNHVICLANPYKFTDTTLL